MSHRAQGAKTESETGDKARRARQLMDNLVRRRGPMMLGAGAGRRRQAKLLAALATRGRSKGESGEDTTGSG